MDVLVPVNYPEANIVFKISKDVSPENTRHPRSPPWTEWRFHGFLTRLGTLSLLKGKFVFRLKWKRLPTLFVIVGVWLNGNIIISWRDQE
ncbi:hypothetical protein RRG08_012841 [Elysia crispata]|uniref:Uncharacterized protein n=1 Tax=Elysia crispata TaxID=231223 RepID=A0AAE1B7F6_9GAST|nr:hypothetical protein RRG08_012841 [Elysia crispata]